MKALSVLLGLCTLVTLCRGVPVNSSDVGEARSFMPPKGLCYYKKHDAIHDGLIGEYIPQCDEYGNFLPQQCWRATGYCWCVDIYTGQELPNTKTPPGPTTVDCALQTYCPYGWSRYGRRCFIFIDAPKTWVEAEIYCMFEKANLVSLHSYEEYHFVQDLTRAQTHEFPQTWIGAHDAIYPCFWMWSDGTKFHYDKWYKEPPMERSEHCGKMNYGYTLEWTCGSCNETLPFVCAKAI